MNGNRRHACTIAICVANVASGVRGRAGAKSSMNVS